MQQNPAGHTRRAVLWSGAGALTAPAVARAAAVTRIRFAHSAPTAHGWQYYAEQFKASVEKRTNGGIQVTIYPNAQMGNENDIAKAVRLGSLEMGEVGVALMDWVPDMSITDAPFLFKSRQQAYAALDGALGNELKQRALKGGFHVVGWTDLGMRCMTNSKHPIDKASDMHDLKMRVPDSKSYIAMMRAMGSTTVTVDLSELYLALSQHVADGQDTPPTVVESNKYYEVQKYISKTDHVLTNAYAIVNPAYFNRLDRTKQAAVLAAGDDATDALRKHTQQGEQSAYSFLVAKGMVANLAPDIPSFQAATASVIIKFPDLFKPDLVTLARSAQA
jgi:TRAP-type transport system periplasmic protein